MNSLVGPEFFNACLQRIPCLCAFPPAAKAGSELAGSCVCSRKRLFSAQGFARPAIPCCKAAHPPSQSDRWRLRRPNCNDLTSRFTIHQRPELSWRFFLAEYQSAHPTRTPTPTEDRGCRNQGSSRGSNTHGSLPGDCANPIPANRSTEACEKNPTESLANS